MMDELISKVTQKTGLSHDQAKLAVETVIGFLKERLPAPIAGSLESLVGGHGDAEAEGGSHAGMAASALGSLFGNKG